MDPVYTRRIRLIEFNYVNPHTGVGGISDTVEVADFGSYEQLITEVRRIWHLSETLQLRFFISGMVFCSRLAKQPL